jgi:predicted O-methyltransferase YrrM
MKNYKFTEDWFSADDLVQFLPLQTQEEIHILEIGSFEGKSTVWFLENILLNEKSTITCIDPWTTYSQNKNSFDSYNKIDSEWNFTDNKNTFLYNIDLSGFKNKVIIEQGFSNEILPKFILDKKKYDIIFIDGNHTSPFVITDGIMSWYLLKEGGLMIFDDYLWSDSNSSSTLSPKLAVDSFVNCFGDYIEVIWSGYRLVINKIK